ncbi:hypothetical protein KAI65_01215 [Candidatus Parcubacteria bacterium]|nr:hypothetical protein [Candidatus Parcubacteria bacterium]
MKKLDYESLQRIASEILKTREILRRQLEKNTLDRPCLKSTKRDNGPVIAIIHVIPIIPQK